MTAAKPAPGPVPKLTVVDNAHAVSPGQRLARARAQRNLSLEEVARHLNLAVSMVKAIESDNFKSLPGHAFVKGYLRNYGKLVGLAPDELVKAYEALHGLSQETVLAPPMPAASRSSRWIAPLIKGVGYLVVLAIGAGLLAVVYQNIGFLADKGAQIVDTFKGNDAKAGSETAPAVEIEAPVVTDSTASDRTIRLSIPLHPVQTSQPPADVATPSTPVAAETPVTAPAEAIPSPAVPPQSSIASDVAGPVVAESVAPVADAGALAATNLSAQPSAAEAMAPREVHGGDGDALVSLIFTGKSWVSVRDADGKQRFNGIRQAGQDVEVQGRPPLRVTIGNAPVVKVSFNGKPFDFEYSNHSNVARLTLGDE